MVLMESKTKNNKIFKMKHIILLTYLITFITPTIYSHIKNENDTNFKMVGFTTYIPSSDITLINDSLYFDNYIVFEAHKSKDVKFHHFDYTYYQFDIYLLDSLTDLKAINKRRYFNSTFLDYYYADLEGMQYDTGHVSVKIPSDKYEEYYRFKRFYEKYLYVRDYNVMHMNDKPIERYFLMNKLRTKIFERPDAYLWKYDSDSVSYFIFRCSFYTAILKYDAYYEIRHGGRVYERDLLFFLPVSRAYLFEPVKESILVDAGFTKSKWFPVNLFLRIK